MAETRGPYLLTATKALAAIAYGAFLARVWLACQARIAAREPAVRAWAYLNPRVAEEAARGLPAAPGRRCRLASKTLSTWSDSRS